jgi:hypothetical protein
LNPFKCQAFDLHDVLPDGEHFGHEHHVIKIEMLLDPKAAQFVHHLVLLMCDTESAEAANFTNNMVIDDCISMPPQCQEILWGWAPGVDNLEFPPDIGMSIRDSTHFLMIQMHYYNPSQVKGVTDSSGLRLTWSDSLRPLESGVMTLFGPATPNQGLTSIPKGKKNYSIQMVIPESCTATWREPITITSAMHHLHHYGVKQTITVTRDGEYVGLVRDEPVFGYYQQSFMETNFTIMPGDRITMECFWDTTTATDDIPVSERTDHDMCFALMQYYPRQPMEFFMYSFDNTLCIPQVGVVEEGEEVPAFQAVDVSEMKTNIPAAPQCVPIKSTATPPTEDYVDGETAGSAGKSVLLPLLVSFAMACSVLIAR